MTKSQYPCVATTPAGFIQRLAHDYVQYGAWFYVTGVVPVRYLAEPARLDAKLIEKYGVSVSRWTRYRQRERGKATIHYLRHEGFWILIATRGSHCIERKGRVVRFFEDNDVRDLRHPSTPVYFWGHSIGAFEQERQWRYRVRIQRRELLGLRAYFITSMWGRSAAEIGEAFRSLPYVPYRGVKDQYRWILDAVNARRRKAGLRERIPYRCVEELRRRAVRPFEQPATQTAGTLLTA